jgi:thioredoxin 1
MAGNGKILEITDQNFADEVRDQGGLAMVDFWATWCGPCRMVAPIVEQLAADYAEKGLRVGKLDVDQNPETASRFGVRSIPTILFFKDGELVDKVIGAVPRPQLEQRIQKHLAA